MNTLVRNELSSIFCYMKMEKKLYKMDWLKKIIASLLNKNQSWIDNQCFIALYSPSGFPGSGVGKGGGGGGSVRDSGGKLGEYGAAQEEHYFFNKDKEQLEKIKRKMKSQKPGELTRKHDK